MDRVAFMDIYKPMYEREKQRAMTPQNLTAQIDAVAASLPDKGQHLLTDREQDRSFQRNEITDLTQLQTLTLRIGESNFDIPLDELADETIKP